MSQRHNCDQQKVEQGMNNIGDNTLHRWQLDRSVQATEKSPKDSKRKDHSEAETKYDMHANKVQSHKRTPLEEPPDLGERELGNNKGGRKPVKGDRDWVVGSIKHKFTIGHQIMSPWIHGAGTPGA